MEFIESNKENLDLINNKKLKKIDLDAINLQELDISNQKDLEELYLSEMDFEYDGLKIKYPNCINLKKIYL